jgi:hypothetical protein
MKRSFALYASLFVFVVAGSAQASIKGKLVDSSCRQVFASGKREA